MTAHATDLLPTASDIAHFNAHGWWESAIIVPDDVLEQAQLGAERHYAGERDHPILIGGGYLDWDPSHGSVVRLNDYVSLQNDDIRQLVEWEPIAAAAGVLAGAQDVRLFHDQLVNKPSGLDAASSKVGWHVDAAYWQTCSSRRMLTAWIPFQDCDATIGALQYVDGSHLRSDTEWMRTFGEQDMDGLVDAFSRQSDEPVVHRVRIRRGQVSFHHCRTIHGSEANTGTQDRVALALHFQDETNHYVRHADENGKATVHINDLVCRKDGDGLPDYSDPDVCPVLWRRPEGLTR